jgi:hypothetical protein
VHDHCTTCSIKTCDPPFRAPVAGFGTPTLLQRGRSPTGDELLRSYALRASQQTAREAAAVAALHRRLPPANVTPPHRAREAPPSPGVHLSELLHPHDIVEWPVEPRNISPQPAPQPWQRPPSAQSPWHRPSSVEPSQQPWQQAPGVQVLSVNPAAPGPAGQPGMPGAASAAEQLMQAGGAAAPQLLRAVRVVEPLDYQPLGAAGAELAAAREAGGQLADGGARGMRRGPSSRKLIPVQVGQLAGSWRGLVQRSRDHFMAPSAALGECSLLLATTGGSSVWLPFNPFMCPTHHQQLHPLPDPPPGATHHRLQALEESLRAWRAGQEGSSSGAVHPQAQGAQDPTTGQALAQPGGGLCCCWPSGRPSRPPTPTPNPTAISPHHTHTHTQCANTWRFAPVHRVGCCPNHPLPT